jgi:hypothetical protein
MNFESVLTDLFSEIPFVADTVALHPLFVIACGDGLDALQLRRAAVVG